MSRCYGCCVSAGSPSEDAGETVFSYCVYKKWWCPHGVRIWIRTLAGKTSIKTKFFVVHFVLEAFVKKPKKTFLNLLFTSFHRLRLSSLSVIPLCGKGFLVPRGVAARQLLTFTRPKNSTGGYEKYTCGSKSGDLGLPTKRTLTLGKCVCEGVQPRVY